MTVRCLTDLQKGAVAHRYRLRMDNQKQLALRFNCSERTINRVLVENGLATPIERIKGDAHYVMQLLKKYQIAPTELERILESAV